MKTQKQTASEAKKSNHTGTLAHETRKNKKGIAMFAIGGIVLCTFLFACSSPESDGKKAAMELCKCEQEVIEDAEKEISNLVRKFSSFGFKNRTEVTEKEKEIQKRVIEKFQICKQKTEEKNKNAREKYMTNEQKKSEFDYALNNGFEVCREKVFKANTEKMELLDGELKRLKMSMKPPKPEVDVERLKRDMVGQSIKNGSQRYAMWKCSAGPSGNSVIDRIKPDHIKEVKIANVIDNGDEYLFKVYLRLYFITNNVYQGQIVDYSFEQNVNIKYTVRDNFEWYLYEIDAGN